MADDLRQRGLKYNQLLRSIVQAEMAAQDNTLPDQLKANLMSLSIFVERQTWRALTNPSEEVFDSMININRNISEGLMEGTK